jgi:hypothetical protein
VRLPWAARRLSAAAQPTVGRSFRELAKPGGVLGRKGDGEPGGGTVWRGREKLHRMLRGAE